MSLFSVGIFFSHSAEKFREGNHSMFQINSGMENFMQKMEISLFSVEIFFSQCQKVSSGESFNVSEIFGYPKILCIRRGYHFFLLQLLFSHTAKKFRGRN